MCAVRGSARRRRTTSKPSIPGMRTSSDHQIGCPLGHLRQRRATVRRLPDSVTGLPEVPGDGVTVGLGVVHHQDADGLSHGGFRPPTSSVTPSAGVILGLR